MNEFPARPRSRLDRRLHRFGLRCFGSFTIHGEDVADMPGSAGEGLSGKRALLIGNAGPQMWRHFSQSPEFVDAQPDPLNRWTQRVVNQACGGDVDLAQKRLLFPFGTDIWPFQRWARRAMGISASPLGMLIHPEFGLWFALRAVLVSEADEAFGLAQQGSIKPVHPCSKCVEKPCLSSCPVQAYDGKTLRVDKCAGHLQGGSSPDCMKRGCVARNACPVGTDWQYPPEQLRFHMAAFRAGVSAPAEPGQVRCGTADK